MTPTEALAEIRSTAEELLAAEDRLRRMWEAVPRSPDEDALFEGKRVWDLATKIRTVVECILDAHLRTAIESLERASRVTEEGLRREFRPGTPRNARRKTHQRLPLPRPNRRHPRLVAHGAE